MRIERSRPLRDDSSQDSCKIMDQPRRDSSLTRRAFLGSAAAVGSSLVIGSVGATTRSDYSWLDDGDDLTRRFDRDELERYLPRFDISRESRDQLIGVYGWIAESQQHDTIAYYYWLRYTHQDPVLESEGLLERALGVLASDAHLWDHEPAIVFVDPSSGAVEEAIVTGYHHYPLIVDGTSAPLTSDAIDQETHLELEVIDPWHHYRLNRDNSGADVTNIVALRDFIEVRDAWESRGIFDSSSRLAIDNPFAMKDNRRSSWWDTRSRDARAARIWHWLGLYGADETDPELVGP